LDATVAEVPARAAAAASTLMMYSSVRQRWLRKSMRVFWEGGY
jgi:hypothetical protein